jgi:hypothetical protein
VKSLLDRQARGILRKAVDNGAVRAHDKAMRDHINYMVAEGYLEEDDNAPGVWRPTKAGEAAIDRWERIPGKAA